MLWIIIIGIVVTGLVAGALIMLRETSYKHRALVAVQTGEDYNDVVMVDDRFRIRRTPDGYYVAEFQKLKHNTAPSPRYGLWQKFLGKAEALAEVDPDAVDERNKWTEEQLKKYMMRGVIFYKTTEGEIKPCTFSAEGKLTIVDQDQIAFRVAEAKRTEELTKRKSDRWIKFGIFAVTLIVSGLMVFAAFYFSTDLYARAAGEAARVAAQAAVNSTVGGLPPG